MADQDRNKRAETARENDDSDIIDTVEPAPSFGGVGGGNLQRDIASQAEDERVRDPQAHEGVNKSDKLEYGTGAVEPKAPDGNSGGGGSGS